jgi:D-beta-D-heptose 7-phosphate kinase / D-beta-D-heptose 1-phosphate adenosyltransferase
VAGSAASHATAETAVDLDPLPSTVTLSGSALAAWLPLFAGRSVLVLGDVMLDRYVLGDVRRISPEAPIPVLRARGRRRMAGGAGNVALNVASMGARAILIGLAGDDEAGAELAGLLAQAAGVRARLVTAAGRLTTVKTRFMSGAHQLLRLDEEAPEAPTPAQEQALLAAFTEALPSADAVILSDYAKGVLTDTVLGGAIAAARAAGKKVIADPKRPDFSAYRHVSVLTPNESEARHATGLPLLDDEAAATTALQVLDISGADAVLVTRSERGVTLVRPGCPALHLPTRAREVADVSGAGDTLVAAFAIMLACGAGLPEAASMANIAAGISVGKQGTATVSHGELATALRERDVLALDDKVADREAALARVAAWRQAGLRVGFTNGCFDLIHPGHVRLLEQARAACDRLVVALNTDASVRRLKGPGRPVQNETARATVMASMAACDMVTLFDEDTPAELIRAILPDVLVKGADYTVDQVVGADIVRANGGKVLLVGLQPGHSTTATIRRIGDSGQ